MAWQGACMLVVALLAGCTSPAQMAPTGTVEIAPGSFFEINGRVDEGSFAWSWQATDVVHFDVHSHFDDEVQYHVEKETDRDNGTFTNDRAGGYSLLWANEGSLPVTLDYRVSGAFKAASYFPPR